MEKTKIRTMSIFLKFSDWEKAPTIQGQVISALEKALKERGFICSDIKAHAGHYPNKK